MNVQRTVMLTVATVLVAGALHSTTAFAQGTSSPTDPPYAHRVRAFVNASNKASHEAKVTPVMSKPLPDFPGKEVVMITVTYPPGGSDPVHRHNAHAFVYVLEGSTTMAVNGGKAVTLARGQTFYEGPNDIHTIGRNASKTKPAKFLVFLIKDKSAPILVPVK